MIRPRAWLAGALACAAVAAAVGSYRAMHPAVRLASRAAMVDVTTGEVFEFDVRGGRTVMVPARNPKTGELSLVPARRENGEWFVSLPDLAGVRAASSAIDPRTGRVVGAVASRRLLAEAHR